MNSTIKYYEDNAEEFINNSINADMTELYKEFLCYIPEGGCILDAGCGSGRDSKYFFEHGYCVEAFDASEAMCKSAKKYAGFDVINSSFEEYSSSTQFDGIWACASLLHVQKENLAFVLRRMSEMLSPRGIMYCSWKYGDTERVQADGKYYCDIDEEYLERITVENELQIQKVWKTSDVRSEYTNVWINVIFARRIF